jgi:hypothetical protein
MGFLKNVLAVAKKELIQSVEGRAGLVAPAFTETK